MGTFVGKALTEIINKMEDAALFFLGYTALVFLAGSWFGIIYGSKGGMIWWPLYVLFGVVLIKVLLDVSRKSGKKK